jgi:hypothetical protein
MDIDVPCPNCGTLFTLRRDLIGKRTKCTRCGTPFVITEPPTTQSPPRQAPVMPQQVSISDLPNYYAATPKPPQEQFAGIPTHLPVGPPPISAPPAASATHEQSPPRETAERRFTESFGFEKDQSQPRFPALRIVARAYEIMAIFVLAVALCLLIVFLIAVIREPSAILAAMLASGMASFWALVTALMLLFISQSIRLLLRIEQNTRETQIACRQLADHLCSIETEN